MVVMKRNFTENSLIRKKESSRISSKKIKNFVQRFFRAKG